MLLHHDSSSQIRPDCKLTKHDLDILFVCCIIMHEGLLRLLMMMMIYILSSSSSSSTCLITSHASILWGCLFVGMMDLPLYRVHAHICRASSHGRLSLHPTCRSKLPGSSNSGHVLLLLAVPGFSHSNGTL